MGFLIPIRTGRVNFLGQSLPETVAGFYSQIAAASGVRLPPLDVVDSSAVLYARLDTNRWIVDCPDCGGAEFVWPETPVMMCMSCFNAAAGGKWRRVELPPDRAEIETVILARPLPGQRHWVPGESPQDLRGQNRVLGVPEDIHAGRNR